MAARLGGVGWRSGLAEWASRTGSIDGFRSEGRETRRRLRRPLVFGGLSLAPFAWRTSLAERLGGASWRSELAEWASRTGFIDGFRSGCRETRQRLCRPLAVGGLSLAERVGGATWRSGLAEWVGGVGWRSGRVERDSSTVSDPSAGTRQRLRRPLAVGGLSLADLIGGAGWRSGLAEWASRTGLIDGFRSECRNSAAASPAAGLWRSQLGGLSLAHLIGGATWRSDLAEWVGGVGGSNGIHRRLPIRVLEPGSGFAGRWRSQLGALCLADQFGGVSWRSSMAVWASRAGLVDGF